MKSKSSLQLTLAILKPHVIKNPFVLDQIRKRIINNDFKIVRSRRTIITSTEASLFYEDHRKKFFYNRLVTFMCSGPSDILILARENAITKWRELLGPTKVYEAQYTHPETIRGKFGLSDTRNAAHGSDSPESVKKEIDVFFPNFSIKEWYDNEEICFNSGKIHFDPKLFLHRIDVNCKNESN